MHPLGCKDASEQRGYEYLLSLGFEDSVIEYEPMGSGKAPDFGLPGGIAVEVTTLVEHTKGGAKPKSLVTARRSIERDFEKLLRSYEPQIAPSDPGWYVSFTFRRPLRKWKELKQSIKACLDQFLCGSKDAVRIGVAPGFTLYFNKALHPGGQYLRFSGYVDADTFGWEQASLEFNIPICLARKATVLEKLPTYQERWLLLVDHVSRGSWEDLEVKSRAGWDRLILLTPEGQLRAFRPPLARIT